MTVQTTRSLSSGVAMEGAMEETLPIAKRKPEENAQKHTKTVLVREDVVLPPARNIVPIKALVSVPIAGRNLEAAPKTATPNKGGPRW